MSDESKVGPKKPWNPPLPVLRLRSTPWAGVNGDTAVTLDDQDLSHAIRSVEIKVAAGRVNLVRIEMFASVDVDMSALTRAINMDPDWFDFHWDTTTLADKTRVYRNNPFLLKAMKALARDEEERRQLDMEIKEAVG